jgi:hypothetical protein
MSGAAAKPYSFKRFAISIGSEVSRRGPYLGKMDKRFQS